MKKFITLFLSIIILTGCSKQKNASNCQEAEIYPRPEMKAILDSFIIACNDKNLIYELYIDKIRNWDYDIVLYSGKRSLIENGHPIMKTIVSDVTVHIYSGIEHYFDSTPSSAISITSDSLPKEIPKGNYWLISEIDGKMNIIKDATSFPFYMSSRVKFVPPVENNSNEEPEWVIESVGRKE
jgi:hypothetical protein